MTPDVIPASSWEFGAKSFFDMVVPISESPDNHLVNSISPPTTLERSRVWECHTAVRLRK